MPTDVGMSTKKQRERTVVSMYLGIRAVYGFSPHTAWRVRLSAVSIESMPLISQ